MTHDEMIAVIQAHKEGKKIEAIVFDLIGQWRVVPNPSFDFTSYRYRVARKVVESIPYRRVLLKQGLVNTVYKTNDPFVLITPEESPLFVGWIDEEWITSKIEVDA